MSTRPVVSASKSAQVLGQTTMRPGSLERLGLGYEDLKTLNQRIALWRRPGALPYARGIAGDRSAVG